MFCVLEGVDGSGKSTLQDAIHKRLIDQDRPVTLTHLGKPKAPVTQLSSLGECLDLGPVASYRPCLGQSIIADRFHWGSPVYGPVFRPDLDDGGGYGEFGAAGWRYMELFVASRGGVTFLVQVSAETAQRRIKARNSENDFTVDQIHDATPELVDRYHWLAGESITLGTRIFEPDRSEIDEWAGRCIAIATAQEQLAARIHGEHGYIGVLQPDVLIVCPPDRELRLEILGSLDDEQWRRVGITSSISTSHGFDALYDGLQKPAVVLGLGNLTQAADTFVYNASGRVASELGELTELI